MPFPFCILIASFVVQSDSTAVIDQLDTAGIVVVDRTGDLSLRSRGDLRHRMATLGADDASLLELPSGDLVCALVVEQEPARTLVAESFLETVRFGDVYLAPASTDLAGWVDFATEVEEQGGIREESYGLKAAATLTRLNALRAQIEFYELMTGTPPDFESTQWSQFENVGFVLSDTTNALSPAENPDRVAVTHRAGADGTSIPESRVGWVWNAADHRLYPAGRTVQSLRDIVRLRDEVITTAAQAGSDDMRSHVLRGNLGALQAAVELFRTRGAGAGPNGLPTIEQLQTPGVVIDVVPTNVINGQTTIQAMPWVEGEMLPIAGDAGWNYDESTGRIWPNVAR